MNAKTANALIKKEVLYPGQKFIPLVQGTRVKFHFQTRKVNDGKVLDDSRKVGKPMELVLGKKFKLEVWEVIVQKMALNEVSKFTVDKSLVVQYPFISKILRNVGKQVEERRHCCGMALQSETTGYKDLDELFSYPSDLEFIVDLFSIELPEEYEKDRWQMSDEEKMSVTTSLRIKGNKLYNENKHNEAEECYRQALGILEQLMLKEKPYDTEWLDLAALKIPLLLNYSQCRLIAKDYYAVITHCNEVLQLNQNNVKALFRRGKAHLGAWNPVEAYQDFKRTVELDKSLRGAVNKELRKIEEEQRLRNLNDKLKLKNLF